MLYSSSSFKKDGKRIYSYSDGIADELKGTLMILMDRQYSVDIVMEHHLSGKMEDYPVIVLPGWKSLADDFKRDLLEYAKNGGKIILIGPETVKIFKDDLSIDIENSNPYENFYLAYHDKMGMLRSSTIDVKLKKDIVTKGGLSESANFTPTMYPAASVQDYGKGKIAMVYTDLGKNYIDQRNSLAADFLDENVNQVFPNPMVSIEGSGFVHVNVNKSKKNIYVHLINTAGDHDNEKVCRIDEIPVLYNLSVWLLFSHPLCLWHRICFFNATNLSYYESFIYPACFCIDVQC